MVNNIPNIVQKLDKEDRLFLYKLARPKEYIKDKYPNFYSKEEDECLQILEDEGLLKDAYKWVGNDGGLHYEINGILHCSCLGSASCFGHFPADAVPMNLAEKALYVFQEDALEKFPRFIE